MKTVTAQFQTAQKREGFFPVKYVYYKRRYWNGSNAYVYEANWTQMSLADIDIIQPIIKQLDVKTLSEFRTSNIMLHLKNEINQWQEENTDGNFAADGVSSYGYEPYLMKFQIRAGLQRVGATDARVGDPSTNAGLEELLTLFTGVAVDWQFDSQSRTVKVTVEGLERLLQNGDAEQISTTVTDENVGTANESTTQFETANFGVGIVTGVKIGTQSQTNGIHYTVSQLNDYSQGAKITFVDAPVTGIIYVSYKYWKRNREIDDFIDDLVTESGITDKSISQVIYDTAIPSTWIQTLKEDWDAGTKTGVDTTTTDGSMTIDYLGDDNRSLIGAFNSGGVPSDYSWSTIFGAGWSINAGKLRNSATSPNNAGITYTHSSIRYGQWNFKMTMTKTGGAPYIYVWFFVGQQPNSSNEGTGYTINWDDGTSTIYLKRMDNASQVTLGSYGMAIDGSEHTIKITRDLNHEFKVYIDGTLRITATDSTYTSSTEFFLFSGVFSTSTIDFDDIYIPLATFSTTFVSQSLDTLVASPVWDKLLNLKNANSATITWDTRVSADNSTWDSYSSLSGSSIQSASKRYLQARAVVTLANSGTPILPKIYQLSILYSSTIVPVKLGNFTGMSCYSAIQELGKFADF